MCLALLCAISGYLTAMKLENVQECDPAEFVIRRYLRLMLPVLGVNVFFGLWQLFSRAGEVNWIVYICAGLVPGESYKALGDLILSGKRPALSGK